MKNRTLGTIALLGAPFLFISFQFPATQSDALGDSSISSSFGLLYLLGWMCSIYALYRMRAAGESLVGKVLLPALLISLAIACTSNAYALVFPQDKSGLYFYLDLFWPISNLLMFVTGVTVALANKLPGWKRFVPLAVGSWFLLMASCVTLFGRTPITGTFLGLYATFAWSLMAVMIMETKDKRQPAPKAAKLIYSAEKRLPVQTV
ncbi:hypothetical protein CLV24_104129 [Pontibacter ummariensis]|uniref:Uncharacterized protein n=1 Tax=Pontibacter ummariensis TaxID=1610492 RepID=A0A239D9Q8_9BACT|nr:hypothetical protein [Pontibacter ummariensis]PRY14319.1 hypothetical protein CLV24_104129 [Pontibacter ummariensis]SNS29085.1 hypothetical protein SAMN06296052_104128 [Pontibacter ummariensis]